MRLWGCELLTSWNIDSPSIKELVGTQDAQNSTPDSRKAKGCQIKNGEDSIFLRLGRKKKSIWNGTHKQCILKKKLHDKVFT